MRPRDPFLKFPIAQEVVMREGIRIREISNDVTHGPDVIEALSQF
jgi:hypothetical protein